MEQQSDYPILRNEWELHNYLDRLYAKAKTANERGERPKFKGLLEIISSPITIQTAVHNIKSNKGADTAGTDKTTDFTTVLWTHRTCDTIKLWEVPQNENFR